MNRQQIESLSLRTPWDSPYRCPSCGLPCTRDEGWRSLCCGEKVLLQEKYERDDADEDRQEDADNRRRRHPGDFDYWPSDQQMEYFKRGGR